jgi:hypothetical protein
MTKIIQLDSEGYFLYITEGDPSPLEEGVILLPGGCIEAEEPDVVEGKRARWDGQWVYEDIPLPEPEPEEQLRELTYAEKRIMEYPLIGDQLDALFHAGVFPPEMAAKIQAVKDKYPKV